MIMQRVLTQINTSAEPARARPHAFPPCAPTLAEAPSGVSAFSSELRTTCEPPSSGSQAPVSTSSPMLTGADPISAVHDLCAFPASHLAHDREGAKADRAKAEDHNDSQLSVKHRSTLSLSCGE